LAIGLGFALAGGEEMSGSANSGSGVSTGNQAGVPRATRDAAQAAALWSALEAADLASGSTARAAEAVVVLAGPFPPDGRKVDKNAADGARHESIQLTVQAMAGMGLPVVVAGPDQVRNDVVRRLIDAKTEGLVLSTVAAPVATAEAISVSWAIAAGLHGISGNYGQGGDFAKLPPYRPAPLTTEPGGSPDTGGSGSVGGDEDSSGGSTDPSAGVDPSAGAEA
jgi:hypothetical protein